MLHEKIWMKALLNFEIYTKVSRVYLCMVCTFDSGVQPIADGKYEEWSTMLELSGGAQFQYIFQAIFFRSQNHKSDLRFVR
jgi:hypothetical protein